MSVNVQTAEGLLRIAGNGGGGAGTVDDTLSETSENPVQNKLITAKLNELDSLIEQTQALRADLETYGMVNSRTAVLSLTAPGLHCPQRKRMQALRGRLRVK